nr:unnamed protein product [Naegleria fowleri]
MNHHTNHTNKHVHDHTTTTNEENEPHVDTNNNNNISISSQRITEHLILQKDQHLKAGRLLVLVPILIGYFYCRENPTVFVLCYVGEMIVHYLLHSLMKQEQQNFHKFRSERNYFSGYSLVMINVAHMLCVFAHQFMTQMYYGPWFPSYILSTYKMIVVACIFPSHHQKQYVIYKWNGPFTILFSLLVTYLSSRGVEMSDLEWSFFQRRLVDMFCLQYAVMVGSNMFSHFLAFKNREYSMQQFKAANERFKNEEKTKFIANLSHEARNPLHCIMGSLQVLNHHFEGEKCLNGCKHCFVNHREIGEIIEDIKENASLLLHILSSSLQMSSLEMGKIQLKHEPFNLKLLLDSLVGVFSQLAHEKQISLYLFYQVSNMPQIFRGDSVRLSQIIMNIISNAIKYTNKGFVRVNCSLATLEELEPIQKQRKRNSLENLLNPITHVRLEFTDTGCGISQDQIHKLFQPYSVIDQTHDQTQDQNEFGSSFEQYFNQSENLRKLTDGRSSLIHTNRNGLGLSITKMLIRKMKGHIKVKSEVGVGTTMTVILPLETGDNSEIEKTIDMFLSENTLTYQVTIIDPDPCFRSVLKDYLSLMKRVQTISCYESFESFKLDHQFGDVGKCENSHKEELCSLFFVPEREYEGIQDHFGNSKNAKQIIIPTIFKGVKRSFPDQHYLPTPIKFGELIEIFKRIEENIREANSCPRSVEGDTGSTPEPNSNQTKTDAEEECNFDFSKFSVLLADDNAVNRKVLMKMLQIIGFKDIDTSNDGMECFEKFKQKSYHLVLLDCFMPILSGKEACEMIRNYMKYRHHEKEEMQRIPIIAITANTWEPRDTLLSQGFDDVVYKPFILADFKKLLTSYLSAANQR